MTSEKVPSTFSVLTFMPAELSDGEALATCYVDAFWDEPHTKCLFPNAVREDRIRDIVLRMPRCLWEPDACYQKTIDESGKIVAYSRWRMPESVIKELVTEGQVKKPPTNAPIPAEVQTEFHGLNKEYESGFVKGIEEGRADYEGGKCIELKMLGTVPEARGRGVASEHVAWGIQMAEKYELLCYADCAPGSVSPGRRLGFREYGKVETDLRKWGGEDTYVHTFMVYTPIELRYA